MTDEDDFDFKRMLEQITDPTYIQQQQQYLAAAAAAQQQMSQMPMVQNPMMLNSYPSFLSTVPIGGGGGGGNNSMSGDDFFFGRKDSSTSVSSQFRPRTSSLSAVSTVTISGRLRAASDMHQNGFISSDQKALMKSLILSRDPVFREELEKAERTGDYTTVRGILAQKQKDFSNASAPDMLNIGDVNLGVSGKDSRKRNASTSTPVARNHKSASATGGSGSSGSNREPSGLRVVTSASSRGGDAVQWSRPATVKKSAAAGGGDSDDDDDGKDDLKSKSRKNERERIRRLAVSNGFDALFKILGIPADQKVDKATILQHAISKIQQLQQHIDRLEAERGGV